MRLVDADALLEKYLKTPDCAVVCIEEAPTIEAVPLSLVAKSLRKIFGIPCRYCKLGKNRQSCKSEEEYDDCWENMTRIIINHYMEEDK